MNSMLTEANPNLMLRTVDGNFIVFIQENKPFCSSMSEVKSAKAQMIAGIVASFQHNQNKIKNKILDSQEFYGIILWDTLPKFYKIKITEELSNAVKEGRTPKNQTFLFEYKFKINSPFKRYPLFNDADRVSIIQSFLGLRQNIKDSNNFL